MLCYIRLVVVSSICIATKHSVPFAMRYPKKAKNLLIFADNALALEVLNHTLDFCLCRRQMMAEFIIARLKEWSAWVGH